MIMALKQVSLLLSFILILLFVQSHEVLSHSHDQKAPPFEFIKHLQGCHKGDKVKGLHELKKYLQNFGYLNEKQHGINDDDDDDFDDLLESAIKTYQLNFHLKATGTLDAKTVSMMMSPRCGVPDIVNGTTWMRSGGRKRHHHHNGHNGHNHNNKIHEVSHYSFFPGNLRWPPSKTHLTYRFLPSTPARAMDPVARAFNRWASATSYFTFGRVRDYTIADITIGFVSVDGPGGTLARATAPTDGRFQYDAGESWSVGASPGAFHLETVALHEIGHLLGLEHSSVPGAIMAPRIDQGVTKGLHGDDIQGIRVLYGI